MYKITGQGLAYLDEFLGSERSKKEEIRTRLLTLLEGRGALSFTELMDIVDAQRGQVERGELGWAPSASSRAYKGTLEEMVGEGLVEEVQ